MSDFSSLLGNHLTPLLTDIFLACRANGTTTGYETISDILSLLDLSVLEDELTALTASHEALEAEFDNHIENHPSGGGGTSLPVGFIGLCAGSAPSGWYILDGSPVSESLAIGVYLLANGQSTNGDGTVNLYDWRDRVPIQAGTTLALRATGGSNTHTLSVSELPPHGRHCTLANTPASGSGGWAMALISGALDGGGGSAHNNLQASVGANYIIYGGD